MRPLQKKIEQLQVRHHVIFVAYFVSNFSLVKLARELDMEKQEVLEFLQSALDEVDPSQKHYWFRKNREGDII